MPRPGETVRREFPAATLWAQASAAERADGRALRADARPRPPTSTFSAQARQLFSDGAPFGVAAASRGRRAHRCAVGAERPAANISFVSRLRGSASVQARLLTQLLRAGGALQYRQRFLQRHKRSPEALMASAKSRSLDPMVAFAFAKGQPPRAAVQAASGKKKKEQGKRRR